MHLKILNLLGTALSKNQIKLLSKGLKFTQTPKPNIPEIKRDIGNFTRKLRLRESFADKNDSNKNLPDSSDSTVRNKCKLNPTRNKK